MITALTYVAKIYEWSSFRAVPCIVCDYVRTFGKLSATCREHFHFSAFRCSVKKVSARKLTVLTYYGSKSSLVLTNKCFRCSLPSNWCMVRVNWSFWCCKNKQRVEISPLKGKNCRFGWDKKKEKKIEN